MQKHDIDERIQKLSDTEIMLNFSQAIAALYPHMKYVGAYCYDAYDELVEPLFYTMVYHSFAWKYGVNITKDITLAYDMWGEINSNFAHIRVFPKQFPFMGMCNGESFEITEDFFSDNVLIFKTFGDGIHNLTDTENKNDPYNVTFNQTEVTVCNKNSSPKSFADINFIWIPNEYLDYIIYYKRKRLEMPLDSFTGNG